MKKTISILLSVILAITFLTGTITFSNAEVYSGTFGSNSNNLSWSLDSNTGVLSITGSGRMGDYSASNNAPWYSNRSSIKSLEVGNEVINLGAYAFYNCDNLTSINFANVDTLGNDCFYNCTSLKEVEIPSNCSWIWERAFNSCTALKYARLENSSAYSGAVPNEMFTGCSALEVVELGSVITGIGSSSFNNCSSLSAVIFESNNLSSVGTNGLNGVPSTCYFVGNSSSSVETYANNNGYRFSSDKYSGLCSDDGNLAWSLDKLSGVLTISGHGDMSDYASPEGGPWKKFNYFLKSVVFDCDDKVSISSKAFYKCTNILGVDFGDKTYAIGWYAFNGCSSLGGINLPDSVVATWSGCFQDCTSVAWINIGNGLTSLCDYMFAGCNSSALWWISIPKNITSIGNNCFDGDTYLSWNTIEGENISFGVDCFRNISSTATFMGNDAATKNYLLGYYSGWTYKCITHKNYSSAVTAPTCTEKGYTTFTCDVCGENYVGDYVDALGHDNVLQSVNSDNYYYTYNCKRCGQTETISALTLKNGFKDQINKKAGDKGFSSTYDINLDGIVNSRDFALVILHMKNMNTSSHQTTVNTATTYQTMTGFGASACWWSQYVGGWDNEKAEKVVKLLYDKDTGIGLNIYRYNLGSGSINDTALYRPETRTESFLQSDGTYNWNADKNARKCLEIANNTCDDLRLTLFVNSPPINYTSNGRGFCSYSDSSTYTSNLPSSNYTNFANYCITCAEHFKNEGYNLTGLSPINEPEWSWRSYNAEDTSAGQEGCYYSKDNCLSFYKTIIPLFNASSVSENCELELWDSGQMGGSGTTFASYLQTMLSTSIGYSTSNSAVRSYLSDKSICFHSYWVDEATRNNTASLLNGSMYKGYGRKMTEFCQMDGSSSGLGIKYGLDLAETIHEDLTILNVNEWDWWVALAEGGYMDGLLYTVYTNSSSNHDVTTSKRFWALGNYSKFIRSGAVRVETSLGSDLSSNIKSSAFLNTDGSLAVVYINTSLSDEYTSLNDSSYSSYKTYVTDETRDLEQIQEESGTANAIIPAQSITTVIYSK